MLDDNLVIGGQQLSFYQINKEQRESGGSDLQRVQSEFYRRYKKILEPR